MKKFSFFLIPLALLIVLFAVAPRGEITFNAPAEEGKTEAATQELPEAFATLEYAGEAEKDAFTLLKENADVDYDEFDFGVMVKSINGDASTADRFWLYYVNGEQAMVGADAYETQDGDTILWRLEESTL